MRNELGKNLTLDLADLVLIECESAPILLRLEKIHGFEIEGMQIFLQKVVNETEREKGYELKKQR